MDVTNFLFLAENASLRINLLYTGALVNTYLSWSYSESTIGFIFCFIYYLLVEGLFAVAALAVFSAYMYFGSQRADGEQTNADISKYYTFNNRDLEAKYKGKKMPIEEWIEAYLVEDVNLVDGVDFFEMLGERDQLFRMNFTPGHIDFFFKKFLAQTVMHNKAWDFEDVATTYNIGNDFYNWFLGEAMVYTSGIFQTMDDSLEQAQKNKMDMVAHKIDLKEGEKHLDIGCGWGTFVRHCAENFGSDSYGVTLSKEQVAWHQSEKEKLTPDARARAKCEVRDYRDVNGKFDKITALEMAEHVGVKNYQKFCRQIYDMLEDDGFFYIQVCGLRGTPSWTFEDLVWGLFMAKYIFPAADASCPVNWVLSQLEYAGFEIHNVENVSIHYCETIYRWYKNWMSNKDKIIKKKEYGVRLFRMWEVFLAWAVRIGRNGTSACYQAVCYKNQNKFDRQQFMGNDLANHLLTAKRSLD